MTTKTYGFVLFLVEQVSFLNGGYFILVFAPTD